jgi:prolyl-tRNA editing enzyme YbaK/EbsC (Cys-tRNA(Pro) deacylase)
MSGRKVIGQHPATHYYVEYNDTIEIFQGELIMQDQLVSNYIKLLADLGIQSQIIEHPPHRAIADVLEFLQFSFTDCMPTLIMKADGEYLALVIRGDCKADLKKVKKDFKFKDLRLATPEEFTILTGLPVGAARVYTPDLKTIIDPKIFEKDYLIGGSGSFSCSIKYKTADLVKIPNHMVAEVTP